MTPIPGLSVNEEHTILPAGMHALHRTEQITLLSIQAVVETILEIAYLVVYWLWPKVRGRHVDEAMFGKSHKRQKIIPLQIFLESDKQTNEGFLVVP